MQKQIVKKYLFEIPVYRISEEAYRAEQDQYIKAHEPTYDGAMSLLNDQDSRSAAKLVGYYAKAFGGGWRYNEIIGFIRIYRCGVQIRAEYWQTDVKRIVKSRKKVFVRKSHKIVHEVAIKDLGSNREIQKAIESCVDLCENHFIDRFLDIQTYRQILCKVDWTNIDF